MKRKHFKLYLGIAFLASSLLACSDILEEQPRSIYEPGFFTTEKGVNGGLSSLYAHLRYIYGQGYYYNTTLTGTDEYTYAQSADANVIPFGQSAKFEPRLGLEDRADDIRP